MQPTLLMSMSEYDLLLRSIRANPSCAPILADRFEEAGLERHATRLREEGVNWRFGFPNLASMARYMSAFGLDPDYSHSTLYANLASLADGGTMHFYCLGSCYQLLRIDGFEDYRVERRP